MRTRMWQVIYLLGLSAFAHVVVRQPALEAADQPVWCELCTSVQCVDNGGQLLEFCDILCDGSFIEFQCIGGATCQGQGGGTYPGRLRCLRDIP